MVPALLVAASFAAGAIPWALWITRWVAGVDVRTVGSGNVGATNASRVLGRKGFVAVFLLDAAKGALPVLLLPRLAESEDPALLASACGLAAVAGHVFNPFLGFRGGKGVATGAGVLGALAPLATACALGIFAAAALLFRFVSLASICAAAAIAPLAYAFGSPGPVVVFAVLVAAIVVVRHRANLARIAAGTEPKIFRRKEAAGG